MRYNSAIQNSIITVHPENCVTEILVIFAVREAYKDELIISVDCIFVIENLQLLGIVTLADILRIMASGMNLEGVKIGEFMRKPVMTLEQDFDINTTLSFMSRQNVRHLAIVDEEGQLLEIVTAESIATALQAELSKTKEQLQQEIKQRDLLEVTLTTASDLLEQQITARTEKLVKVNKLLQRKICDRIATEAQLLQTTSELQELFQAFPDIYLRLKSDGTILSCHTREISDLYMAPEKLLGKLIQDVLPPDIGRQFQEAIAQLLLTNSLVAIEYSLPFSKVEKSFEAIFLLSITNQIIILIRNITERKKAEKALQAAKDELEIRVEERTYELKNTNARLRQEIRERQLAENQLKASLKEKEVLLKEIHHRVKNNLQIISSLLRLQAGSIKNEQILDIFQDSQNRVRAMAMIHENLYQSTDLARIQFSEYVQNLTSNLLRCYKVDCNIKINLNIDKSLLRIDTAIPCGLIINELISNSIKYAFINRALGEISISFLLLENGKYSLSVSDNGVGISEDIEIRKQKSLGLQLVWNLVEQLEGTIAFYSTLGTLFVINFLEQN